MHSDSSATPPTGAAGEAESHYQDAVDTLRELEAKHVFAVLEDAALGQPAMMAAGILVIHRIEDDVVHVTVGDGALMSIWREPSLPGWCVGDRLTLESAGMRLTLLPREPPGPESIREWLGDVVDRVHPMLKRNEDGELVYWDGSRPEPGDGLLGGVEGEDARKRADWSNAWHADCQRRAR